MVIPEMTSILLKVRDAYSEYLFIHHHADHKLVRTVRARIIPLRNDYKSLSDRIETGLHAHHAALAASEPPVSEPSTTTNGTTTGQRPTIEVPEIPFAKVTSVIAQSPAEEAGLRAGDRIRRFGSVNWMNHEKLTKVAETVQRLQGVSP